MVNSRLTFLFTSDEHGFVTPQAKLQAQVDKAREDNPDGTLLISSGDVFEGSAENGVLGIESSRKMMEAAGYDVVTMGNHDFDLGSDAARQWIKDCPANVLVANVKNEATGELLENAAPSQIFEMNGVKVGLIGVTTQETTKILPHSKWEGLRFEDPVNAVKQEVHRLQEQGIEVIGLVSHLGLPEDRKMADQVPELDFILGGHTHDALKQAEVHGQTLIAHPGSFRKFMGKLELEVDPQTGKIASHHYALLNGEEAVTEGPVGHLASEYKSTVAQQMGKTIGTFPSNLSYNPNRLGEEIEDLMTGSVSAKADVDLVMLNKKGLRTGFKAGDVTAEDIYNAIPFNNHAVTVDMTAGEAASVLEQSMLRTDQSGLTFDGRGKRATDGGVALVMDVVTKRPHLVRDIALGKADMTSPDLMSSDLEEGTATFLVPDEQVLSVGTNDYLLAGGLNYFTPASHLPTRDLGLVRDVLSDFVGSHFPKK